MPCAPRPSWLLVALLAGALVPSMRASAQSHSPTDTPQPAIDAGVQADKAALSNLFTGGRYRITPGDVIEFAFPYVQEFNQTVSVQPDGYISLRGTRDIPAAGRTVPQLKAEVIEAYEEILRDPVVTLVLKEFEKPYFVVGGEVARPGKYDLRGATTVTQALAIAGGNVSGAKLSDVVLFRRYGNDLVDVKRVNVSKMYEKRDVSEDPVLRAGDTLFIPKSGFAKIAPYLPKPTISFYVNPLSW